MSFHSSHFPLWPTFPAMRMDKTAYIRRCRIYIESVVGFLSLTTLYIHISVFPCTFASNNNTPLPFRLRKRIIVP